MEGLQHADSSARGWVGDGRELGALVELPETPAGGDAVRGVGLNRAGEGVDEALIGVGRLVDDDFGAGGDAARLFDVERGFVRAGLVAGSARAAVNVGRGRSRGAGEEDELMNSCGGRLRRSEAKRDC